MTVRFAVLQWTITLLMGASPLMALANNQAGEGTRSTAFVDVSVLSMDANSLVEDQTVLVHGGEIERIGSVKSVRVPAGAITIDGRHRYLMPGLTDFHVHFPDSAQDQRDELKLLVSNGITTAVNMHGTPDILAMRNQLRQGKLFGTTLYSTGPYVNEPEFTSPEQVRHAVIAQKAAGYDFIKIHGELSIDAYTALINTSREQHIRVVGHVPAKLGIDAVLGK